MLNFNQYEKSISEGFVIKDDIIYFDANNPGFINTSFGKYSKLKPYQSKLENGIIYSVYKREKSDDDMYKEVLSAIKGQNDKYKMDYNSYIAFINRSAIYMSNLIIKEKIDTILVMDSSSPLVSDLTFEINRRLPQYYSLYTFNKQIFKTPNIEDIFIDTSGITIDDKSYKSMQSSLNRMKRDNYFKIHNIHTTNRKFIKNWLKINNNILSKVIDKRVAIIDDILTTGATLIEAANLLNDAGASYVVGLTIIKGK